MVLVDIGGGTTDISIYERGTLAFNSTLPVGEHITRIWRWDYEPQWKGPTGLKNSMDVLI